MAAVPEGVLAAERSDAQPRAQSAGLTRFTNWILGIYLAVALTLMLVLKVTPSIDVFFVFGVIGAVLLGRGVAFVRDWGPFVLIFFAWEGMRGIANQFGQAVHSDSVIAIERFLFLGTVPTADLQHALRTPGQVTPLDFAMTFVYVSHFFFPLALAFFLWLRDRPRYYRFVTTLMAVSFASFFTFLLFPVAPPRYAVHYGQDLAVVDVMEQVFATVQWGGFDWVYTHLVGNPVAAFPSMHAAYPLLVLLFLAERWKRAAIAWAFVTVTIWFAVVYLGHHYVVDVIGGIVYALVGYFALRHSDFGGRLIEAYTRAFRRAATDVSRLFRLSS
jgi:membrane-associated phospholipid phosphatase